MDKRFIWLGDKEIRIPTPYGFIECRLGAENDITVPPEIQLQQ